MGSLWNHFGWLPAGRINQLEWLMPGDTIIFMEIISRAGRYTKHLAVWFVTSLRLLDGNSHFD